MECNHYWAQIGQTYTMDVRTLIYWCTGCGALKYKRTAWDYAEWIVLAGN